MENIYQRNLRCLEEKHPPLAQLMKATQDLPAISLKKSSAGTQELFCNFADGSEKAYYPEKNSRLYSQKFIQNLSFKNPRILVFLGVGLGHHLIEYAKQSQELNQVMIVIEAMPQVFKKALEVNDLSPLFNVPQVQWFVGSEASQLRNFFNRFFSCGPWLRFANAVEFVEFPPSLNLHPAFYKQAKEAFAQATAHHFNRVFGDAYDGFRGTEHMLLNLEKLLAMPSLAQAAKAFEGKDGLILASGPSLAKSLDYIRQAQDKAILIACPSALPLLLAENIQPHFWINIERDEVDGTFLASLAKKPPHVFAGPAHIHPLCFSGNGGLNTYVLGSTLQSRWLPLDGPILGLGHSSAHAAFKILELLGCSRIFLMGQDLCYNEKLESHATGVWVESQTVMMNLEKQGKKILEIEGNSGSPVKSNLFWVGFLKTFSEQLIPEYSGRVFNVMPENMGAKIFGAERINPEELIQKLNPGKLDVFALLLQKLSKPSEDLVEERREEVESKKKDLLRALRRLIADNEAFALRCKKLQFSPWVLSQNWEQGKEEYMKFTQEVERFSSRYASDANYAEDLEAYQDFFHPIIQGILIRGQIEYFSSAEDLQGNFQEIHRKCEVLFQMAKDEAFWADCVLKLL